VVRAHFINAKDQDIGKFGRTGGAHRSPPNSGLVYLKPVLFSEKEKN